MSAVGAVDVAAAFNEAHEVGAIVRYWTGAREGEGKIGYTWYRAQSGANFGTPIVYIRERGTDRNVGAVALTHVEALTSDEVAALPEPDPLAPAEVEVTMTVSWRVTVDPRGPKGDWSWLEPIPRHEWAEAIRRAMEDDTDEYPAFCAAADGPYSGPDYTVEVNP